jgi:hypothetical protein
LRFTSARASLRIFIRFIRSGGEGRVHAGTNRSQQPIEFDLQAA